MDALATIAVEIQATLTGSLVIMLIFMLQILDLRGAKQHHNQCLMELSRYEKTGENKPAFIKKKYRFISSFSIFLQFVFGIIVFAAFLCWGFYLLSVGFIASAVLSGITALVAIVMPFLVWFTSRRKNHEMAARINDVERQLKNRPDTQIAPEISVPEPVARVKDLAPEPIVVAKPVAEAVLAARPEPVARTIAEPKAYGAPGWLPEDSMLLRHYLAHLQNEKSNKETALPTRPTDSMLRRHYDSMMASRQPTTAVQAETQKTQTPETKSVATAAADVAQSSNKQVIPQDSMLRRHFLAHCQSMIEADLPPQPTDSMLKRHFANWKNGFIEQEILKLLSSMHS